MRRVMVLPLALVVFQFIGTLKTEAQDVCHVRVFACTYDTGGNPGGNILVPRPPSTANCQNVLPWCVDCRARSNSKNYKCKANNLQFDCPSCPQTNRAGGPIDTATGNTYIEESDISIPGLGGGLRLTRKWNSIMPPVQQSYPFMFGANWRSNWEQRLVPQSTDGYLKFAAADSSVASYGVMSYGATSGGAVTMYSSVNPPDDTASSITESWDGTTLTWVLLTKNGEKRNFDGVTGILQSITDRNGNLTQLSYDASHRLTTVTDPAGRHLYFNYTGQSTLVSTVTSDVGITTSYAYDPQGHLTQVTKPDNTTISFQYDANSNITAVLDTNGKVLESHTYDASHRGLTSSRANGVEAVTITYH